MGNHDKVKNTNNSAASAGSEAGGFPGINRLLNMMNECNQILVRAENERALLEEICQIIIRDGGYRFVWIGFFDQAQANQLIPVVYKGLVGDQEGQLLDSIHCLIQNMPTILPSIRSGQPFLENNVSCQSAGVVIPSDAKKLGYASLVILPLLQGSQLCGVLAIYSAEVGAFEEKELKFLVDLAADLSFGLLSVRTRVNLKKAQEDLKDSQQMLQLVMDTIPIRLFWKDKNFIYMGCNKAFAQDAGLNSPEEIVGKNDFELSWKKTAPLYRSDDTEIIRKNISKINYEEPQVRENGSSLWLRTTKIPLQNKQGEIIGLFGSYEDITEKKRAEEALRESERRYKMATTAAKIGVWDLNLETNQMYIDPILKVILGYNDDEITNRLDEWIKLIHPEDVEKFKQEFDSVLQRKLSDLELSYRMVHREGSTKWIITRGRVVSEGSRKTGRMVGTHMDITQQKEIEQEREKMHAQLLQAQKMEAVGTLAGGMAHDFNNLLTTIRGFTDLSLQIVREKDPLQKNLKQIQKAVQLASNLTHQLLLFSRKQIMEPISLNINETIRNMLLLLERVIGEDIQIKTDFYPDLWRVYADEGNLEQVIMNLAVNSRDAMPKGGTIFIATNNMAIDKSQTEMIPRSRPGQFVRLTFSDTGTGMTQEVYQHLFEPFFTTKEQGKGTGLGLSVVYGIVTQHHGWINVTTELGKGTTFEIYLPASFVKSAKADKDQKSKITFQSKGEMVLVIEDEEGIRDFISTLLAEKGFKVFLAGNAQEALTFYSELKNEIRLLITDVILPDRSGLDIAKTMTAENPDLTVILCSGYAGDKCDREEIQKLGYFFLRKPFSMNELLHAVYHSLQEKAP